MGWKLKLLFLIIAILVGLNIFLPQRADEALNMISENTGINKDKLQKGVDLATNIAKDSAELAKDKASEVVYDVKNKIK